jgi:hypothetical protein
VSALAHLQRDFLRALAGGDEGVLSRLHDRRGVARERGLGVYVHAYGARLREALGLDHAALASLLGEDAWIAMADAYIAAHPSRHASLRHFGDGLPGFLRSRRPWAGRPLLAELAAFERALLDSFDAADAAPAEWDHLLALPPTRWAGMRPVLVPSLARQSLSTPAVECWRALKRGEPAPTTASVLRSDWAIWRDGQLVTRFRSLAVDESALLDHVLAGGDFAGGCERLQAWHPAEAVPARALALLECWCGEGWIAAWR